MLSGLKLLGLGLCASALYLAAGCAPDLSTLDALYDPNATGGASSTVGGHGNTNPGGGDPGTAGSDTSGAGMNTGTAGSSNSSLCSNLHKDANETDVDCGGSSKCGACASGLQCNGGKDCISGYCTSKGRCADPTCADGVQNQDETALDCGGETCDGCDEGDACNVNSDCASTFCKSGACANHCDSGKKDGDETAIDCGGKDCDPCKDAQGCVSGDDCVSKVCINKICKAATCTDQVTNQDESDQDCGGTVCAPCAVSAACNTAADCASYVCTNHKCVADINVLSDDIIDDFEDSDTYLPTSPALGITTANPDGRIGSWYAFGDSGCLVSRDNQLLTVKRGKSTRVMHTTGLGCNAWGNGLGVDFDNPSGTKYPYDATGTKGVTFWARAGKPVSVTVAIPNIDTDSYVVGHTCDAPAGCDHHWFKAVAVTTDWQRFTVQYTSLSLEGGDTWTAPATAPTAFVPSLVSVQFREAALASTTESYDLWIDDVAFVR